ncbi:hypothetical protein AAE02nite_31950 [Adhaeribacter aerolatus]|uniref:HTH cro/C1-type domain-containing protein n=1 Tax=Adhaeribacter aerolatus TaxID=670289 RepID=A0A512B0P5_9BACT|nr:hypothetical protein [Adhaeribacter aerolatus]GEO05531.1 hypothetical protein AAE02nite_31950 [Adhaeribacter aerolatus]
MKTTEINFEDDLRYVKVKIGLTEGKIKSLDEVFKIIPITHIARKLNLNAVRLQSKIKDPSTFRVSELQAFAKLIDIDFLALMAFIYRPSTEEGTN